MTSQTDGGCLMLCVQHLNGFTCFYVMFSFSFPFDVSLEDLGSEIFPNMYVMAPLTCRSTIDYIPDTIQHAHTHTQRVAIEIFGTRHSGLRRFICKSLSLSSVACRCEKCVDLFFYSLRITQQIASHPHSHPHTHSPCPYWNVYVLCRANSHGLYILCACDDGRCILILKQNSTKKNKTIQNARLQCKEDISTSTQHRDGGWMCQRAEIKSLCIAIN